MRLIDADELKKALAEMWYENNIKITGLSVADLIDEAPTIEPSGDLISREEAIEVENKIIEELSLSSIDWDDLKYWAKELFDALPSAETHEIRTETHGVCSDFISRQDAIAYIDRVTNSGLGRNKSLEYIRKYISALPSADRPQVKYDSAEEQIAETCDKPQVNSAERMDEKEKSIEQFLTLLTINALSDGQATDRPKGEWIITERGYCGIYKCSNCGHTKTQKYHFCPNCGADMRGAER